MELLISARSLAFVVAVSSMLAAPTSAATDHRLVDAARNQDPQAIAALLKAGADVNASQPDGATALHWAAHWDDLATVDRLLKAGARVDPANDYGVTPLWLACENASVKVVDRLLAAGANAKAALPTGETVLMTAARTGSASVVTTLIAAGADVNAAEQARGQTALMWAASEGHLEVARVLLDRGAQVNARSKTGIEAAKTGDPEGDGRVERVAVTAKVDGGFTALLFAVREGTLPMVRLLLEHGADLNAVSARKANALITSVVRGHVALAQYLLEAGMDPNFAGPGYTALHWAAGTWESVTTHDYPVTDIGEWRAMAGIPTREGKLSIVRTLLAHGADPNARLEVSPTRYGSAFGRNEIGATPFYLAAIAGDAEVMRVLLANGADPAVRSKDNSTPLIAAAGQTYVDEETAIPEVKFLETVQFLVELGADVNAANRNGETALHAAASEGLNTIIEYLAGKGANVNARNENDRTPLSLAEGANVRGKLYIRPETAALLRKLGGIMDSPDQEEAHRLAEDSKRHDTPKKKPIVEPK